MRSEGRFPATNNAPGTSWGARLPESPQEGLCLLKHLKGVLVEFPFQGGAWEGEPAPTKLWVTTKPAEAAEPSDALSRGSRPSQRVCVLFIQANRGYSFQPVRETLGYVTLGMKKMRLFFFFSWRKVLRNSPETAFGFHGHSPRSFYITRSTVRALDSGVRTRVRGSQRRAGGPRTLPLPTAAPSPIRAHQGCGNL